MHLYHPTQEETNFARRVLQAMKCHPACRLARQRRMLRIMVFAALCGDRRALDDFWMAVTSTPCGLQILRALNAKPIPKAAA